MSQPNVSAERVQYIERLKRDVEDAEKVLALAKKETIEANNWEEQCFDRVAVYKSNLEEALNE